LARFVKCGVIEASSDHLQAKNYAVIKAFGCYFLANRFRNSDLYFADHCLALLASMQVPLKGKKVLSAFSGAFVESIYAAKYEAEVTLVNSLSTDRDLFALVKELNGLSSQPVMLVGDESNHLSAEFDYIIAQPPCLISSPDCPLPKAVDGGPDGTKGLTATLDIAATALNNSGKTIILGIGYSSQGIKDFQISFDKMTSSRGLSHQTIITGKFPMKPGPGGVIFNEGLAYSCNVQGVQPQAVVGNYMKHVSELGFKDALLFKSEVYRNNSNDQGSGYQVIDLTNEYYGTWFV